MNGSACARPWASDEFFGYSDASLPSCSTNSLVYVVLMTVCAVLRTLVTIEVWKKWLARRAKRMSFSFHNGNADVLAREARRRPVFPALSVAQVLLHYAALILPVLDIASARNGGTVAIFGLLVGCWELFAYLTLRRIIHLGRKFLGVTDVQFTLVDAAGAYSSELLKRFDVVLMIAFSLQAANVGAFLVFAIPVNLGLVAANSPSAQVVILVLYGLGAADIALLLLAFSYQLERMSRAIQSVFTTSRTNSKSTNDLAKVQKDIRYQQAFWVLTGVPALAIFLLLSLSVIPSSYLAMVVFAWLEMAHSAFGVVRLAPKSRRQPAAPGGGSVITPASPIVSSDGHSAAGVSAQESDVPG